MQFNKANRNEPEDFAESLATANTEYMSRGFGPNILRSPEML